MNAAGSAVIWIVIQVTVFGSAAALVYAVTRRLGPAVGAFVSFTAMVAMTVVAVASMAPWPSWFSDSLSSAPSAGASAAAAGTGAGTVTDGPAAQPRPGSVSAGPDLSLLAEVIWRDLQQGRDSLPESASAWHWTHVVALLVLLGIAAGILRLFVGLMSIAKFRRTSRRITDRELSESVEVLAAELGCTRPIRLCESSQVVGAATFGWRHPVILLPPGWRQWSVEQRRAVLAHELAHIKHHDYRTWLMAQIGLAVHFYHPLAHYLCRCLRLDQELVADAVAAGVSGGRQPYLYSLAQIALQQSDVSMSWPARAFLPTRKTFLRRIDMLRNSKATRTSLPLTVRSAIAGFLVVAALAVLGVREPGRMLAVAQEGQRSKSGESNRAAAADAAAEPFSLSYVPRDVLAVAAVRPSNLLLRPVFQPLTETLRKADGLEDSLGILPEKVESLHVFVLPPSDDRGGGPIGAILRVADAESARQLGSRLAPRAKRESYADQEYFGQERGGNYFIPDDRTVVYSQEISVLRRSIVAGKAGAEATKWAKDWQAVAGSDAAAFINTSAIAALFSRGDNLPPEAAAFSPLWEKSQNVVASLEVTDSFRLRVVAHPLNVNDARRVRDTLGALITTARNMLSPARDAAARSSDKQGPLMLSALDIADHLLENVKVEPANTDAEVRGEPWVVATVTASAEDSIRAIRILAPAVGASRAAARRMQSANNLKQLALAFHNYADVHRRFPPAVLYHANGTPRSWRVELLPYLDAAHLYRQYRQDLPWDSPENKIILEQMPEVFRDPNESSNSLNSSYFVLVGEGTVFDKNKNEGSGFADILDGTSNTILAVEAKRNIPWTKPEDIPYDDSRAMPTLGGYYPQGFQAALCDGSVRFLSNNVDQRLLRLLILRADGQPVQFPQ